jgi:hypothetical protein
MKAVSKAGLLFSAALMACAAMAIGAQAQVNITPDNTPINGVATDPTLNFEGVTIVCPEGTASGTTDLAAPDVVNVELTFGPPGECNLAGLTASTECSTASGDTDEFGTAMLRATDATSDLGIVEQLNEGFFCTVEVLGLCQVTVTEQDLPSDVDGSAGRDQANLLNGGTDDAAIDSLVDVEASSNNPTCGPSQGDGGFSAVYELDQPVAFE